MLRCARSWWARRTASAASSSSSRACGGSAIRSAPTSRPRQPRWARRCRWSASSPIAGGRKRAPRSSRPTGGCSLPAGGGARSTCRLPRPTRAEAALTWRSRARIRASRLPAGSAPGACCRKKRWSRSTRTCASRSRRCCRAERPAARGSVLLVPLVLLLPFLVLLLLPLLLFVAPLPLVLADLAPPLVLVLAGLVVAGLLLGLDRLPLRPAEPAVVAGRDQRETVRNEARLGIDPRPPVIARAVPAGVAPCPVPAIA